LWSVIKGHQERLAQTDAVKWFEHAPSGLSNTPETSNPFVSVVRHISKAGRASQTDTINGLSNTPEGSDPL